MAVALSGVDRLYLFPEPRTATEVVAAAVRAGVRRIVTLSSGAVSAGLDDDFQVPVERAVEASGLGWTHLRPGEAYSAGAAPELMVEVWDAMLARRPAAGDSRVRNGGLAGPVRRLVS